MKRSLTVAIAVLMLWPMLAWSKPKQRTFTGTQQQAFAAAHKVARENYAVTYVDEKRFLITFESGGSIMATQGFICNATVEPEKDGKATVTLNVKTKQFDVTMGAGGRLADKYFDAIDKELKVETKQQPKS